MAGISNETIVNFFEKEADDDLKKKMCFSVKLCKEIYFFS